MRLMLQLILLLLLSIGILLHAYTNVHILNKHSIRLSKHGIRTHRRLLKADDVTVSPTACTSNSIRRYTSAASSVTTVDDISTTVGNTLTSISTTDDDDDDGDDDGDRNYDYNMKVDTTIAFIAKAGLIGFLTGASVAIFKTSLAATSSLFYESLADLLPKPSFYWPLGLYPIFGSVIVAILTYFRGPSIRNGIDYIAMTVDSPNPIVVDTLQSVVHDNNSTTKMVTGFNPVTQFTRLCASVVTLGSGISLGPEGPSVEIGASWSRLMQSTSAKEKHHLFLAGTAAGVAAGFNAPLAGVFFAIECGNRYLSKNTIKLDEQAPDGPRADIAAIILSSAIANIVVELGLHENQSLHIQGNLYAMVSPVFELSLYMGLGVISGMISVLFTYLRDFFAAFFAGENEIGKTLYLSSIPHYLRPLIGGIICGIVAIYYPQTIFVGYTILDQLIAGKFILPIALVLKLLGLKILLTSLSLGTGLIGGVFAPALFFGATAGTAYHNAILSVIDAVSSFLSQFPPLHDTSLQGSLQSFFSIADAPAYATVGAAATLGALFRAPLTASMLLFEITQNHDIVLPVLVSTGIGGLFSELVNGIPAYNKKERKQE